ncbi:hypothetical protein [Bilophila wadsworthia]|uniref:hypothetical protein n=1 Tax=Bilophila wadsworthia TaxID=35833 RepID=UPI00138E0C06|nr:hypothetical protein [Bilophila wadsworthia]
MESFVHLLITRHRAVWRVRILIHRDPRIRWRAYRVAEYPTPEAVARRCAAGLVTIKPENKPHEGEEGHLRGDIRPVHDSPLRVRWECWERLEIAPRK